MQATIEPLPPQTAFAAQSDTGRARETNEDHWTALPALPNGSAIFALADGMGGANAGETAAHLATTTIDDFWADRSPPSVGPSLNALKAVILEAHTRIERHAERHPDTAGMGTTLVLLRILPGGAAQIAWAGDSRCYFFSDKTGLRLLTKDHSHVQTLVDAGKISPDMARFHPQSNIILQSLGSPGQPPEPSCLSWAPPPGENGFFLLCSDGLHGMLADSEIEAVLKTGGGFRQNDLAALAQRLVEAANDAGGADNVTVVLARAPAQPLSAGEATLVFPGKNAARRWGFAAASLAGLVFLCAMAWFSGIFSNTKNPPPTPDTEKPAVGPPAPNANFPERRPEIEKPPPSLAFPPSGNSAVLEKTPPVPRPKKKGETAADSVPALRLEEPPPAKMLELTPILPEKGKVGPDSIRGKG